MSIVRVDRRRRRAFTLLEVTLAVAILGMMAMAIYRFVSANLTAVRISTEINESDARYEGLANLLTGQWQDLPPGQGTLSDRTSFMVCGSRKSRRLRRSATTIAYLPSGV